jgi:hypothetical protein
MENVNFELHFGCMFEFLRFFAAAKCTFMYTCSDGYMFICPLCEAEVSVTECFRDRAVTMELKKATIQCTSPDCPWQGRSDEYKVGMFVIMQLHYCAAA